VRLFSRPNFFRRNNLGKKTEGRMRGGEGVYIVETRLLKPLSKKTLFAHLSLAAQAASKMTTTSTFSL
jgi:hypothetical protein